MHIAGNSGGFVDTRCTPGAVKQTGAAAQCRNSSNFFAQQYTHKPSGFEGTLVFGSTRCPLSTLGQNKAHFLCGQEQQRLAAIPVAKRQLSFLRGRYIAQSVLRRLCHSSQQLFPISLGAAGQPIVEPLSGNKEALHLAISHTDEMAVALATSRRCPMSLDLERVDLDRVATMATQMTQQERDWVGTQPKDKQIVAMTFLWCAKEALSKLLEMGLSIDFKALQLQDICLGQDGQCFEGYFSNFHYLQVDAVHDGQHMLALVRPKDIVWYPGDMLGQLFNSLQH